MSFFDMDPGGSLLDIDPDMPLLDVDPGMSLPILDLSGPFFDVGSDMSLPDVDLDRSILDILSDMSDLDADGTDRHGNPPASSTATVLGDGPDFAVYTSGNRGCGGGGSSTVVCDDLSDDDSGDDNNNDSEDDNNDDSGGDDDNYDSSTYPRTREDVGDGLSVEFWMHHPNPESEQALHNYNDLDLAVDASGNGGSGGGGSNVVVCGDLSDEDNDDGSGSANPWIRLNTANSLEDEDESNSTGLWSRDDAIKGLKVEFWMYHPARWPGQAPPHDWGGISIGPDHPHHDLYLQVLALINRYFDELASRWISNMVVEIKDRVKRALDDFHAGGYGADGKHWSEGLPGRAELMLTRFVVSYDAIDRTIAAMLGEMRRMRMLYIPS